MKRFLSLHSFNASCVAIHGSYTGSFEGIILKKHTWHSMCLENWSKPYKNKFSDNYLNLKLETNFSHKCSLKGLHLFDYILH